MKLLIAGDLHGSAKYATCLKKLKETEKPDKIILLGDLLYHGPRNDLPEEYAPKQVIEILNAMKEDILAVRGNCEAEVDQMVLEFPVMAEYALVQADDTLLFVTHGHKYGVENPPPAAKGTVLVCGHTHVGTAEKIGDITYLNPGSLSIPKDGHHSYMIFENNIFTRKDIAGTVLDIWPK